MQNVCRTRWWFCSTRKIVKKMEKVPARPASKRRPHRLLVGVIGRRPALPGEQHWLPAAAAAAGRSGDRTDRIGPATRCLRRSFIAVDVVRLKRTNRRVIGLSLNRSQKRSALLSTTPRLRTRSSTNDLAPLRRMWLLSLRLTVAFVGARQ